MNYTNVNLDFYNRADQLQEDLDVLTFKLKQKSEQCERLKREIENIYKATLEYGYIDLSVNKEKKIRLIIEKEGAD